jgi:hypothetical protein
MLVDTGATSLEDCQMFCYHEVVSRRQLMHQYTEYIE